MSFSTDSVRQGVMSRNHIVAKIVVVSTTLSFLILATLALT